MVSIATPTALHAPIATAALDAGLHVLSEKPMAENSEVGRTMVEAARRNDRVLDVSFNHRRRGDVQALKKIIDAGLLGHIYYAKAGWLRREGIPGLGSWFTRVATAGGGPLMDIGVHMLDMALHLLGEPTVTAATAATYAEFGPRGKGASPYASTGKTGVAESEFDVEDLSTAFLRLAEGGTLLIESSWAQWIPHDQCYVAVYGSDGGANIEWGGEPVRAVPEAEHLDREGGRRRPAASHRAAGRRARRGRHRLHQPGEVGGVQGSRRRRGVGPRHRGRRLLRLRRRRPGDPPRLSAAVPSLG